MKQHIYQRLSSHRRKLGMSQQDLAMRAGVRREKLNRMESRGENIGIDQLCRLLDAAGLELDVREKGQGSSSQSVPAGRESPSQDSALRLAPQPFHQASFIEGSKAKILHWGKLPR